MNCVYFIAILNLRSPIKEWDKNYVLFSTALRELFDSASTLVRDCFGTASSLLRVRFDCSSATSRSPVEGLPNNSRTLVEHVPKESQRIAEEQPTICRRRAEQDLPLRPCIPLMDGQCPIAHTTLIGKGSSIGLWMRSR